MVLSTDGSYNFMSKLDQTPLVALDWFSIYGRNMIGILSNFLRKILLLFLGYRMIWNQS